jgi:ubiquinone/menaquinone biosynthesis C-methylase UbiE
MKHQFDTNAPAHQSREAANAAGALQSLEDWVISILPPQPGMSVLDLGCGTGKLALPYARKVGSSGSVLGLDIAPESLKVLEETAQREGLDSIETLACDLDAAVETLCGRRFDRIVSSYALYYSEDMVALLRSLRDLLNEQGEIFVCGPGEGTNREMADLVLRCLGSAEKAPLPQPDFLPPEEIARVREAFVDCRTHRLPNVIRFRRAEDLLNWWRNHNSYVPQVDAEVENAVREHFERYGEFGMTKNVLGVHLRA